MCVFVLGTIGGVTVSKPTRVSSILIGCQYSFGLVPHRSKELCKLLYVCVCVCVCARALLKMPEKKLVFGFLINFSFWQTRCHNCSFRQF